MANPTESSGDALVRRARRDADALGTLYDRHYSGVLRYAVHRLFNRQAAEDVTGEVFLAVARQIRAFRGETERQFAAWLYAIATNRIHATIRTGRRRAALLEDVARVQAQRRDDPPADVDWPRLYSELARLGEREQTLVTLRCLEGWPYDRVAETVGISPQAARVAVHRALKRLRDRLGDGFGCD